MKTSSFDQFKTRTHWISQIFYSGPKDKWLIPVHKINSVNLSSFMLEWSQYQNTSLQLEGSIENKRLAKIYDGGIIIRINELRKKDTQIQSVHGKNIRCWWQQNCTVAVFCCKQTAPFLSHWIKESCNFRFFLLIWLNEKLWYFLYSTSKAQPAFNWCYLDKQWQGNPVSEINSLCKMCVKCLVCQDLAVLLI